MKEGVGVSTVVAPGTPQSEDRREAGEVEVEAQLFVVRRIREGLIKGVAIGGLPKVRYAPFSLFGCIFGFWWTLHRS